MSANPYDILGVPSSASDDEVKKAYRRLAKQYHPDIHPDPELAEKKMAEINTAYDEIQAIRQGKATGGYSGSYGGYQSSRQGSSPELTAVRNYLHYRRFQEAFNVLNRMEERNAEWYFLSAFAHYGVHNRTQALEYARKAAAMDPNNMEYQQFLQHLQMGGMVYETYGRGFSMPQSNMMDKLCTALCLAKICCPYC